jgi:hypothetical protein
LEYDDDIIKTVSLDEIMNLRGGGDWHMAYLCLYRKLEIVPKTRPSKEEEGKKEGEEGKKEEEEGKKDEEEGKKDEEMKDTDEPEDTSKGEKMADD